MVTESHIMLAKYFSESFLSDCDGAYRFAFYLGSIAPDFNPVTFLRGFKTVAHFRGHHYEASLKAVRRLMETLSEEGDGSWWDYYCLGKLAHYMVDGFTWPHNLSLYTDTIKAHMSYEHELNGLLFEKLKTLGKADWSSRDVSTLYRDYLQAHASYVAGGHSMEADMTYALKTVGSTISALQLCFSYRASLGMAASGTALAK